MAFEKLPAGDHPVGIFAPALAAIRLREDFGHEDHEVVKQEVTNLVVRALRSGAVEFADESILRAPELVHSAA